MIYAFVASIMRDAFVPKRGTGKTLSLVYFLYHKHLEGRRVITNFFTPFSEMMSITDIIIGILNASDLQKWKDKNPLATEKQIKEHIKIEYNDNIIEKAEIGLTEFQHVLDNLGHKALKKRIWRLVVSQSRKLGLNFYLDLQILNQADNDARDHVDYILIPKKYHTDFKPCNKDDCEDPNHRIIIYVNMHPWGELAIKCLNAEVVGKLYDTTKITIDPIQVSKLTKYSELFGDLKIKGMN